MEGHTSGRGQQAIAAFRMDGSYSGRADGSYGGRAVQARPIGIAAAAEDPWAMTRATEVHESGRGQQPIAASRADGTYGGRADGTYSSRADGSYGGRTDGSYSGRADRAYGGRPVQDLLAASNRTATGRPAMVMAEPVAAGGRGSHRAHRESTFIDRAPSPRRGINTPRWALLRDSIVGTPARSYPTTRACSVPSTDNRTCRSGDAAMGQGRRGGGAARMRRRGGPGNSGGKGAEARKFVTLAPRRPLPHASPLGMPPRRHHRPRAPMTATAMSRESSAIADTVPSQAVSGNGTRAISFGQQVVDEGFELVSSNPIPKPDYSGYLRKSKPVLLFLLKDRFFFTIQGQSLSWHASEEDFVLGQPPRSTQPVDVTAYTVLRHGATITLVWAGEYDKTEAAGQKQRYKLTAESEADAEQWELRLANAQNIDARLAEKDAQRWERQLAEAQSRLSGGEAAEVAPEPPPARDLQARLSNVYGGESESKASSLWYYPQINLNTTQKVRRAIYEAVLPYDKGAFRWESLVPWLPEGQDLTTREKFIVCSTFIGIALVLQHEFDSSASVNVHLGYIAQFFSYAIGNPIGYRTIAIVSSLLEIAGDLFELGQFDNDDAIPVIYNVLFLPINLYYVMTWGLNREVLVLSPEEERLYDQCFQNLGFEKGLFCRLLRTARFTTVMDEPLTICTANEELLDLFVVLDGKVDVVVGGTVATQIGEYQLIGEASLLECLQSKGGATHQPSRATVIAPPGVRFVSWRQQDFYELQEKDSEMKYMIQLMISRTLSQKLAAARDNQANFTNQQEMAEKDGFT